MKTTKLYKLKHLNKLEVVSNDSTGCTFILVFDNHRGQVVSPPHWTMNCIDDRNLLILGIFNTCKEILYRVPELVGIDILEPTFWEIELPLAAAHMSTQDASAAPVRALSDLKVTDDKGLVSQTEKDVEILLGMYAIGINEADAFSEMMKSEVFAFDGANVHALLQSEPLIVEVLQGLEVASAYVDDMDEWLRIYNWKLRLMTEDIILAELRNKQLEMQSGAYKPILDELDNLLQRLRIPSKFAASLTGGSFDESEMRRNLEACEWLTGALHGLEAPNLDPAYMNMQAVKEKRAELEILKKTFVQLASEFLRNFFSSLADFMINDCSYFSQRGQLKRPDHSELRYKCRIYARLLQHLKHLDKSCLGTLRKLYCQSLNLVLRREACEFANELCANQSTSVDTSVVSEVYSKMLTIFIPLLVDESSFFAHFMCFGISVDASDYDVKPGNNSAELVDAAGPRSLLMQLAIRLREMSKILIK